MIWLSFLCYAYSKEFQRIPKIPILQTQEGCLTDIVQLSYKGNVKSTPFTVGHFLYGSAKLNNLSYQICFTLSGNKEPISQKKIPTE